MAIARPILGLLSLLLLAGSIVMQFLVILSGAIQKMPVNSVYFLEAATNGFQNPNSRYRNPARWTYWAICAVRGSSNSNCSRPPTPALPFDIPRNFGTSNGVPNSLQNQSHYFYLSRFAWVFYLIALVFTVLAFFLGLLALCTRLGSYLSGMLTSIAMIFQGLAAALMTAWTVQARNAFRSSGRNANIGTRAYAFSWAPFAALFLGTILFCLGGASGKNDNYSKKSYFGRKRSTRSRGSFIDNESQRRVVKDEYE